VLVSREGIASRGGEPKLTFCSLLRMIRDSFPDFTRANMTNLEPTVTPTIARPKAGFTTYAEKLNGRAAMLGFVAIVAIEYLTGKGIMTWLGLA
jgi:hypothetical protein